MKIYKGSFTKKTLLACLNEAEETGANYISVLIENSESPSSELIVINRLYNFDYDRDYYDRAYNDDLTLKKNPDNISIVGFGYGNKLGELVRVMNE